MKENKSKYICKRVKFRIKNNRKKLLFRALAIRSDEGLALETSALESLYGG